MTLASGEKATLAMCYLPQRDRIACTLVKPGKRSAMGLGGVDPATGLADKNAFLEAAAKNAGGTGTLALVNLPGLSEACASLSPPDASALMSAIGERVKAMDTLIVSISTGQDAQAAAALAATRLATLEAVLFDAQRAVAGTLAVDQRRAQSRALGLVSAAALCSILLVIIFRRRSEAARSHEAARLATESSERRFRALTEQQEAWALEHGYKEMVVKTKNKFYEMRGTLDHLHFEVVLYERNLADNAESKVYLSKKIVPELLRRHRSSRTVVQATL